MTDRLIAFITNVATYLLTQYSLTYFASLLKPLLAISVVDYY